jgi:stage II sporulation protein R
MKDRNIWIKSTAIVLTLGAVLLLGGYHYQDYQQTIAQEALVKALATKVIRFHVLANSDDKNDQAIKLAVRDGIGTYLNQALEGVTNEQESRAIITAEMDEIIRLAQQVITKKGSADRVTASLTRTDFPEKSYGDFTFPAGEYEALQVIIGSGAGKNWWCVMYPNLCFFNSMYEVVSKEGAQSLEQVLTKEEYKAIMEGGQYKVRFKWLSFLNR